MQSDKVKVSIVIPVYQVESYVERCLESVFAQTYRRVEVILVDDCGTDDSMRRVELFLNTHVALDAKIVKHEQNRGLSAARNTGLDAATGDYVLFLDSDDALAENAVEALVKPLEEFPYEMVIGDYVTVHDKEITEAGNLKLSQGALTGNPDILAAYAQGLWYVMAWNKLCSRHFLLDNKLYFSEGFLHEDVIWTFKLACKLQSMYAVQQATYQYTVRNASIMTSMSVEKDVTVYLKAFGEIIKFLHQENRLEGAWEYYIIEGKKTGILYSLLQKGENGLYRRVYPEFHRQCYISPWKAFRKGMINGNYLLRDLHYCLPACLGRIYKRMFYRLYYSVRGKRIEGAVWGD